MHDVENTKETRKSILDMAMGAIKERADYEMARVIDNIQDINVPATGKRKLIIEVELAPDALREKIGVTSTVKSKLVPTAPIGTMLYSAPDENGEVVFKEMTMQTPGQYDMFGGKQAEPAQLKLVK